MPGLDPLDRKAPCPRRYTFVSVPIEYPLDFAFLAREALTAEESGLALRLGAAFFRVGDLRLLTGDLRVDFLLRTAIGFSHSFAINGE